MECILAAGAVVARKGPEVLLVHRPKYDDWSFPKGKRDPGEHITTTAVREVAEETGLDIRLAPPLSTQRYEVGNGQPRTKEVHYWTGRVVGGDDVSTYVPNSEIDEVVWLPVDEARARLTYPYDANTLREFEAVRTKTYPLIVVRHARGRSRTTWRGDDRDRPLTRAGELQAEGVVPILEAYGVRRVVSSSSRRCWTTVSPYADVADVDVEVRGDLAEEDATRDSVSTQVLRLLERKEPAVLCTHRPVLPWVFEALALGLQAPNRQALEQRALEPGEMLVVHHREREIVAVESHSR